MLKDNDIEIPNNIPILYYGGFQDEARKFLKKCQIDESNMYNIPDEMAKSGNKVEFHKLYEGKRKSTLS